MSAVTVSGSAYGVEAFLCDGSTGTRIARGLPFVQGNLVTLCVQPDADARADGVVVDRIESFTWSKQGTTSNTNTNTNTNIAQPAVANGSVHRNGLSVYSCASAHTYCTVSSILSADFYESAGLVGGFGAAYLGFGNSNNSNSNDGNTGGESDAAQPVLRDFVLDLTGGNGSDNNDGSDAASSNAAVENGFVGAGSFEEVLDTTEEDEEFASNEFNVSTTGSTGGGAAGYDDDDDNDGTDDDGTSTNTSAFESIFE
uniref:Uncharacterized protein n=1 Tax=Pseudo-nitzschia australis TaxID=44445 RepID=A0A7S4ALD5_9STRA|mmetsp:Transcript_24115/g.52804  ORF Transcript_24115/g.52804 Transcript_24115/m.52804 type:complete len:256 (+) Transcript_24115:218-985(+)